MFRESCQCKIGRKNWLHFILDSEKYSTIEIGMNIQLPTVDSVIFNHLKCKLSNSVVTSKILNTLFGQFWKCAFILSAFIQVHCFVMCAIVFCSQQFLASLIKAIEARKSHITWKARDRRTTNQIARKLKFFDIDFRRSLSKVKIIKITLNEFTVMIKNKLSSRNNFGKVTCRLHK